MTDSSVLKFRDLKQKGVAPSGVSMGSLEHQSGQKLLALLAECQGGSQKAPNPTMQSLEKARHT